MSFGLGVTLFFVALLLAVLIHEAGHFAVAKWFDFKVEEFFVGFGPRVWSFRRGETEYGVKAFPLGGYVKVAGMNPFKEEAPEDVPRSYGAKPAWQRALMILAGPGTHILVALVLYALYLGIVGQPHLTAQITQVVPKLNGRTSPASAVGLRAGDAVARVGPVSDPTTDQFGAYLKHHVGTPITMAVERNGRILRVTVTPILSMVQGELVPRVGTLMSDRHLVGRDRAGVVGAVSGAIDAIGRGLVQTFQGLGRVFGPSGLGHLFGVLFGSQQRRITDPVSPVGIGRAAGQTVQYFGFGELLPLLAGVNLFVGLINLVPLPPFDGGHLAVLTVETIRGRKVDQRKLVPVAAIVLLFLGFFVMASLFLDIAKPLNIRP